MIHLLRAASLYILLYSSLISAADPLVIGIENFEPPFIMRSSATEAFGYDIDVMNYVCKELKRSCVFKVMQFAQLIPALINQDIELAIGDITITSERAQQINFSIPYLLSYSRFLSLSNATVNQPFSLNLLESKKIGVEGGSIFAQQIQEMGIQNSAVVAFPSIELALEGLRSNTVDFVLLDNPAAIYWEANSSGAFKPIGDAYQYGFGIGIAISPASKELLPLINQALEHYQNSINYQINYNKYLAHF